MSIWVINPHFGCSFTFQIPNKTGCWSFFKKRLTVSGLMTTAACAGAACCCTATAATGAQVGRAVASEPFVHAIKQCMGCIGGFPESGGQTPIQPGDSRYAATVLTSSSLTSHIAPVCRMAGQVSRSRTKAAAAGPSSSESPPPRGRTARRERGGQDDPAEPGAGTAGVGLLQHLQKPCCHRK
jgi:hypothetical protein